MKKLIFVRHGRAEEQAPEISDFERSLTLKGKALSKLMVRKLREKENAPGVFITSPAFRALETAIIFAEEYGIEPEKIIMNSSLYFKMSYHYLTDIIALAGDDTDTIMLFGHNPSFSDISSSLIRGGCDFMPKTGVIGISFNIKTWKELKQNTGKMEYFLKPEKVL
jgi:phosphohistidine phosphatase